MSSESIFYRKPSVERRVVVTGLAAITPLALTYEKSWAQLLEGQSGIASITQFDTKDYEVSIAGEVKDFNPRKWIDPKTLRKMERFTQFAVVAGLSALKDSGLTDSTFTNGVKKDHLTNRELIDSEPMSDDFIGDHFTIPEEYSRTAGCIVGVGISGLDVISQNVKILEERGPSRISPFFIPKTISNIAPGHLSLQAKLKGPSYTITSACASGAHAIGEAMKYIRYGFSDIMLAGGSESAITPLALSGFASMRALSTRNTQPEMASRPWDRDRDGFVFSEGAGMLVLEDYEKAVQRGARIYCEIAGYGASCDAFHLTNPDEDGIGAANAINLALKDAQINHEDIDYINAHGTSTPIGDEKETLAIKRAFGAHARKLSISSTKSMTGHLLGAAGAIEAIFTALSVSRNQIPPTINLENPSPDCDLNYTPHIAVEKPVRCALSNSFGFGGTNACLAFQSIH